MVSPMSQIDDPVEQIRVLSAANRAAPDASTEQRLVLLRHEAFDPDLAPPATLPDPIRASTDEPGPLRPLAPHRARHRQPPSRAGPPRVRARPRDARCRGGRTARRRHRPGPRRVRRRAGRRPRERDHALVRALHATAGSLPDRRPPQLDPRQRRGVDRRLAPHALRALRAHRADRHRRAGRAAPRRAAGAVGQQEHVAPRPHRHEHRTGTRTAPSWARTCAP